jgi:hypothetical protein
MLLPPFFAIIYLSSNLSQPSVKFWDQIGLGCQIKNTIWQKYWGQKHEEIALWDRLRPFFRRPSSAVQSDLKRCLIDSRPANAHDGIRATTRE